jgi:hypothetical protein
MAHEITPVMADETLAGMADGTRVSIVHEIIPVVANFNIVIIVGSAAEEIMIKTLILLIQRRRSADEPQPLQIIPFADQRDEPRTIDPIDFIRILLLLGWPQSWRGFRCLELLLVLRGFLGRRAPLWWLVIVLLQGLSLVAKSLLLRGLQFKMLMMVVWQTQKVRGVDVVPEGNISLVKENKPFFLCLSPLFVTCFFFFFFFFGQMLRHLFLWKRRALLM